MAKADEEIHVFVVHARALQRRARSIAKLVQVIERHNMVNRVNMRLITKYDINDISPEDLPKLTNFDPVALDVSPFADRFNGLIKVMHINQVSCALKHAECLREISEYDDDRMCLVIEDDCVAKDDDINAFVTHALDKRNDYDILFGCDTGINFQQQDEYLASIENVFASGIVLATCNAYFVRPSYAKTLLENTQPIKFAWNVQLSFALHRCKPSRGVKCAPCAPLRDGSKTGRFLSTQTGENVLSQCDEFVTFRQLLATAKVGQGSEVARAFDGIIASQGIANDHPDILRVYATYLTVNRRHKEAHDVLQRAVDVILKEPLTFSNNQSAVMKQFLRSFAHVQG